MALISVEAAQTLIQTHWPDWGDSSVSLEQLRDLRTTEPILADRPYPPDHRIMMDGIAIAWSAYEIGQREFGIAGVVAAGEPKVTLNSPEACLEVMTGCLLPQGADLVIPYEQISIDSGRARITLEQERNPFDYVHLAGSDCSPGAEVLRAQVSLNGPRWGIAASMGYTSVQCQRLPRIKLISTGNELIDPANTPQAHQLRRSNVYALKASLLLHGYEGVDLDHLADDRPAMEAHYQDNTQGYDVLIYSGGVSKGKFDYLPDLWRQAGVAQYIQGVAQRPGKPLWFGIDHHHNTVVLGLPGNPVSSLVCLHRYLLTPPEIYAQLQKEITFTPDLTYFLPVKLRYGSDGIIRANPLNIKNSGEFIALADSDGFLELPRGQSQFPAGACYRFFSWLR